ncbi:Hypothetical protein NATL1_04421 [Prochlorococcus marinus str. NATL1A]|uniref:Uncharacterized protein n=1 Tax=Prochlorococcus marinus (strain NATL1A) TaxID=167555 RepID=A2C0J6_PROM1|nr:Hypothetical protein NATL1_04421 [Prochlorococcus marinus str. NATL1A]
MTLYRSKLRLILHTTSMSKEFDSKMKFRNQTSLKRLTKKNRDSSTTKPSLIAILLVLIAFLQVPISLKASINIFCLFSEISETDKTFSLCNY